jgi:type III pantothenate kinase
MILLVDAGNSRIKWACLVGGTLQAGEPLQRSGDAEDDVHALSLAWAPLPPPRRVLLCSVLRPAFLAALSAYAQARWAVAVEAATSQRTAHGVVNAYAEPQRLGVDRWLALLAARSIVPGAACVVDCGTAITVDGLRADGVHVGGLILPGLALMRRMLRAGTEGIAADDADEDAGAPPASAADTRSAVLGGTLCMAIGGIDRAVAGMRGAVGGEANCLIGGGDAERLLPWLDDTYIYEPGLVLKGLAVYAQDGNG